MGQPKRVERDDVWAALVKFEGDRAKVAMCLRVSERTLNRYISEYGLHDDMEKNNLKQRKGPPVGGYVGETNRHKAIKQAILERDGILDLGELAMELYESSDSENRQRVSIALNDLKIKGVIAYDGVRWFLL